MNIINLLISILSIIMIVGLVYELLKESEKLL